MGTATERLQTCPMYTPLVILAIDVSVSYLDADFILLRYIVTQPSLCSQSGSICLSFCVYASLYVLVVTCTGHLYKVAVRVDRHV